MGRLQRNDGRSGGRLYFLVHKHVLSRSGPKLAHPNWFIQVFYLLGSSNSNPHANAHCDSGRKFYTDTECYADTNSYANANAIIHRTGSDAGSATRLNFRLFQRHVHVERWQCYSLLTPCR